VIIENEFSVAAQIDAVWRQLLDMEGVASCLPGATINATDRENVYDGSMRLKIGPMRVEYRGTATLSEIDEQSHTAVISLSAREAKGQGSAIATIRNRLEPLGVGTRVRAETELEITGAQAQFGRGVIEDVGKRVLKEFSQRLEQLIAGSPSQGQTGEPLQPALSSASPASTPGLVATDPAPAPVATPDELDIGALVSRTAVVRIAGGIAVALLAIALIVLRRRR
jgi:uncharacterized protein